MLPDKVNVLGLLKAVALAVAMVLIYLGARWCAH